MTISLRMSNEETSLIKAYAAMKQLSVSELIRRTMIEKIEDEYDLKSYEEAMAEYKKNPITYSHEEVMKMLELE